MTPTVPPSLERTYGGWEWEVAYQGAPQAITYRVRAPDGATRFIKLAKPGGTPTLESEALRLEWARGRLPVPRLVASGSDHGTDWLVTEALPGRDAVRRSATRAPERLARIMAAGLREFHAVPPEQCPFDFRIGTALELARKRLDGGRIVPARDFHPEHAHLSARAAVELLERDRPMTEDLVVCHGDFCPPNLLLDRDWEITGYVDLGELGVADRWWDLAVAGWSLTWNVGPGWEADLLSAYGARPDPDRRAYYRLLYDVVS